MQHEQVILHGFEVSEAVAQNHDHFEDVVAVRRLARIALAKVSRQAFAAGLLFGFLNEIAGAIQSFDLGVPAAVKLQSMAALAAAQIEDVCFGCGLENFQQRVDLAGRDAIIGDHIGVGFDVERGEDATPPVGGHVRFQVADRTERL